MPDFDSIPQFNSYLERFVGEFADDMLSRIGREVGKQAVAIADAEAARDLGGDRRFSGWAPTLDTRAVMLSPGVVSVRPTPRSAGPWTVATVGRNQGGASGFQGPGVNKKTGGTKFTKSGKVGKVRATGGRRWNGRTRGRGTADRAVARMEPLAAEIAQTEVRKTINKFFS